MTYSKALAALADPTRRGLYERLRKRPQAVGALARAARISPPAVSQHLRVLREARLVNARPAGTRRLYYATPEGLVDLRRYFETLWDDILVAFSQSSDT
jgi:DNA-binding transcriptional ArsR family regulator